MKTRKASPTLARHKKTAPASPVAAYVGLALILAAALNMAVGYWGYTVWIQEKRLSLLAELSREQAQTTAEAIAQELQNYQQRLGSFAKHPAAAAAFDNRNSNPQAINTLKQQLRGLFPAVQSIHALPAGVASLQTSAQAELRFTELDMIARAEEREAVLPEASKQGDQWLINLVTAVPAKASAPVVGTLLISLPMDIMLPALEPSTPQNLGRVALQQSFNERRSTLLLSSGQGQAGEPQVVDILGSYWQLEFTPSVQLRRQAHVSLVLPIAAWVVFSIGNLALAFFLGRWLGRRKAQTQQWLAVQGAATATNKAGEHYPPENILDIEISDEDEALLGLEENKEDPLADAPTQPAEAEVETLDVPEVIFRAYDIRGLAETEITPQLAQQIGQALGSEALDCNQNTLVVARDARTHSPLLAEHLVRGILSTGCGVINIGTVPTPLMYFATETLSQTQSGVMVTASHNDAEYNGFKVVINGKSRSAEDIQNIRQRILTNKVYSGQGREEHLDIAPQYIDTIFSDVALAGDIHIVLDAGNGVTGDIAPRLFEELGCRVTPLFCELDGTFPNHAPDPSVTGNLQNLVTCVKQEQADLGVAFDGDGDRLTVVTPKGDIVWADRLLMLFAKDIVTRNPGADVVFDVKSTRHLNSIISNLGGRPVMWKTGHAPMRAKMLETGALIGAEFSGHVFIKERWFGFDDGLYATARLIEIISLCGESLDAMLAEFPSTAITPEILIPITEEKKFAIVRQLQEKGDFGNARLTTLDGLRADFPYGWGLVRASNTSANLTLRFEADTGSDLRKIKALFARELNKIDSGIHLEN